MLCSATSLELENLSDLDPLRESLIALGAIGVMIFGDDARSFIICPSHAYSKEGSLLRNLLCELSFVYKGTDQLFITHSFISNNGDSLQ